MSICVIVADSSKARILMAQSRNGILEIKRELVHDDSRLKEQELVADGTGITNDSGGYGKHSMGYEKNTHQRQAEIFAHELSSEIDKIRQSNDPGRIHLIAAPKFLGLLRNYLNKQCTALLVGEINKNLVNHSIEDIRSHLPRQL